jgi:hypothetical protein
MTSTLASFGLWHRHRCRRAQRVQLCLVLAATLVLLACAGSAAAGPRAPKSFRLVATKTVAFASDGVRFAAWQTKAPGPIVFFDTRTGGVRTDDRGCALAGLEGDGQIEATAAAARFLIGCAGSPFLLNAATGGLTSLPSSPAVREWRWVGERNVIGFSASSRCRQSSRERRRGDPCLATYNLATSMLTYRPLSMIGNPDRAGAPPICPRLRPLVAEELRNPSNRRFAFADGLVARSTGRPNTIALEHCSGRRMLIGAGGDPVDIDLRGGQLSWDTGHEAQVQAEAGVHYRRATLTIYRLRTKRRQSWALPSLPLHLTAGGSERGVFGFSARTSSSVFWIATETLEQGTVDTPGTSSVLVASTG